MPLGTDDRYASCGGPWTGSLYCPPCEDLIQEIEDEIMACPRCGRRAPDEGSLCPACEEETCRSCRGPTDGTGALCPPCQEEHDWHVTCPGCGGSTPDPGELCPPCEDERDEALREVRACPSCGGTTPDPGELCPPCEAVLAAHCDDE